MKAGSNDGAGEFLGSVGKLEFYAVIPNAPNKGIEIMATDSGWLKVEISVVATRIDDGSEYATCLQRTFVPKEGLRYVQKAVADGLFALPDTYAGEIAALRSGSKK